MAERSHLRPEPEGARRGPLAGFADRFARAGHDDTVRLREIPFLSLVDLRVHDALPDVVARVEAALGLAVPHTPARLEGSPASDAGRSVLWLGPDWWLVVGPSGTAAETVPALRAVLGDAAGSVVDVSAGRAILELAGPRARDVLMTGCPIDLHPRAFPVGACAQTLLGRAQVVLGHVGDGPTFWVLVPTSFGSYLAEWLLDALVEFT